MPLTATIMMKRYAPGEVENRLGIEFQKVAVWLPDVETPLVRYVSPRSTFGGPRRKDRAFKITFNTVEELNRFLKIVCDASNQFLNCQLSDYLNEVCRFNPLGGARSALRGTN